MQNNGILSKRIPTILGLVILVGGLVAGVLLVGKEQGLSIKASPTSLPRNVRISNRSSNSFVVSWTTDIPVTGFLKYSDNPTDLANPAGDSRDQVSGSVNPYTTHYVEVSNLKPETTYYFEIGTGSQNYNDDGKPYQIRTTGQLIQKPEEVSSGKIVDPSGNSSGGAIVYLELNGSETLSSQVRTDGGWRIPISNARDKQGKYVEYDSTKDILTIFVQGGAAGTATAIVPINKSNPSPEITLGKNQSFAEITLTPAPTILPVTSNNEKAKSSSGFSKLTEIINSSLANEAIEASSSVKILNPGTDGEKINTTLPEFIGTGGEGLEITLALEAPKQGGVMTIPKSGNWKWSPTSKLPIGKNSLTVAYKNSKGEAIVTKRDFEIVNITMAGSPAFTATPSATPTIATPTAVVTLATSSGSASSSSKGRTTMPSTASGVPQSGILTPTISLLIVGLGLFSFGLVSRKKFEKIEV